MTPWLDRLAAEVQARRVRIRERALVIALAGGVASGKTTVAERLARRLKRDGLTVEVVSTDGFLYPNAILAERGLMERKGFPDSYDNRQLAAFLAEIKSGAPVLSVPSYSHAGYDVGAVQALARPDVLILEGLIALQPDVEPVDLGLYLDAEEGDLIAWYTDRFLDLERWASPRLAERLQAVGGDPEALAHDVWSRINGPNLREHIAPTRARADVVLIKARDHSIRLTD